MASVRVVKEDILLVLDELPPESLHQVQEFIEFLRFKDRKEAQKPAVALEGILEGYHFGDQDILEARRKMWGRVDVDYSR